MPNPTGRGGWEAGRSGNPSGRPPKGGALAEIVSKAGGRRLTGPDGKSRQEKTMVAQALWELAAIGKTELGDSGKVVEVHSAHEWLEVVSWLFDRVEGKPKASAALVVPGDDEGRYRFTLNLGDALEVDEGLGEAGEENGGSGADDAGP
jgi:hypothetical protein